MAEEAATTQPEAMAVPATGPMAGHSDWFQWYHVEEGYTLSEIALYWFAARRRPALLDSLFDCL